MHTTPGSLVKMEKHALFASGLDRMMLVDIYTAGQPVPGKTMLLFINDGQNMEELGLTVLLEDFVQQKELPVVAVAIHAGAERKMEYGVAAVPDYLGRGALAGAYSRFIQEDLISLIHDRFGPDFFQIRAFAGFSLGGLSAMDFVWNHPDLFQHAGVFSGSLWWRSVDQDDPAYNDDHHRIMHQEIRRGKYKPGLSFFFQCGNLDETMDRNNNGIIDSIDDTLDMIRELELKGYSREKDIAYLEMPDGRHDVATWAWSFPAFLQWVAG